VVIGPDWLDVRDDHGNRCLDNPNDFVRIEIAAALLRNIRVVPILLDGAIVPKADQLPKDVEELALRNALNVHHASFHSDMDKLVHELKDDASKNQACALKVACDRVSFFAISGRSLDPVKLPRDCPSTHAQMKPTRPRFISFFEIPGGDRTTRAAGKRGPVRLLAAARSVMLKGRGAAGRLRVDVSNDPTPPCWARLTAMPGLARCSLTSHTSGHRVAC